MAAREGSPEPRPQQPGTGGHPARGPGGSRLGAGGKPGEGVRMEEQSLSREVSVADPVVCGRRQGQVAAGVGGSWGAGVGGAPAEEGEVPRAGMGSRETTFSQRGVKVQTYHLGSLFKFQIPSLHP